ncbi:MAG: hypothetical protein IPM38_04955 [Ignavibacteria bacterium]|nr:hypothetical protein [Ignavibacteria bacterium]
MNTKLTLKLNNKVIEQAKIYAKEKDTSLSKLIESYLEYLTSKNSSDANEITPLVKSISGVLQSGKNLNVKKEYKKHILKKYSL